MMCSRTMLIEHKTASISVYCMPHTPWSAQYNFLLSSNNATAVQNAYGIIPNEQYPALQKKRTEEPI